MGVIAWGLLGPETLASERRTRTLGLGATVRSFNDLAVPGLGGVWFGKQLFLATLGVAIAKCVRDSGRRMRNTEVANAVEALACWLALDGIGWKPNPRLRGATKMRNRTDLSFAIMRKPSFYVTQPMRQATVQPMRALGLAESAGERFNAFDCLNFRRFPSMKSRAFPGSVELGATRPIGTTPGNCTPVSRTPIFPGFCSS